MKTSLGIIETHGLIASIEAADAMLKSAYVKLMHRSQPGSGLTLILCVGELADCQVAVAAGAEAAKRVGILYSEHIIARPSEELDSWLEQTADASPLNKRNIGVWFDNAGRGID